MGLLTETVDEAQESSESNHDTFGAKHDERTKKRLGNDLGSGSAAALLLGHDGRVAGFLTNTLGAATEDSRSVAM